MDRRFTLFDYLSQVFMTFGVTIFVLNVFCLIVGESAKEVSSIFSLGSSGLSVKTNIQFLLSIAIIIIFRFTFFTDFIIKKMPLAIRIILMFLCSFLNIVLFIIFCGWFPPDNLLAWGMLLLSFAVSCIVSTLISVLWEKSENHKFVQALSRLKGEKDE